VQVKLFSSILKKNLFTIWSRILTQVLSKVKKMQFALKDTFNLTYNSTVKRRIVNTTLIMMQRRGNVKEL